LPHTPVEASVVCTHERRPGTTVCLRCRHDARVAARDRMKRLMLRGGALTIVAATVITAATLGGTAMRGRSAGRQAASPAVPTGAPVVVASADSLAADSVARATQTRPESIVAPAQNAPPSALSAPAPILPMGESPLSDGMTANRGDSAVVVSFDVQTSRTRRAQKFEQIVRTTLPAVYGPAADSALAHIPNGEIAQQGDLLSELTVRGVRIRLTPPWEIRVYPETRSGPTGPLVVRYRALVVSGG
jgi:hypothetical protein